MSSHKRTDFISSFRAACRKKKELQGWCDITDELGISDTDATMEAYFHHKKTKKRSSMSKNDGLKVKLVILKFCVIISKFQVRNFHRINF